MRGWMIDFTQRQPGGLYLRRRAFVPTTGSRRNAEAVLETALQHIGARVVEMHDVVPVDGVVAAIVGPPELDYLTATVAPK